MPEIDALAVFAAAVAAFAIGGAYYTVLGDQLAAVRTAAGSAAAEEPPAWTLAVESVRCLVLAAIVAGLASQSGIGDVGGGILLGLALWIGFPLVLWTGAIVHERTPWRFAAIHAGDWLVKLVVIAVIVSAWQ